MHLDDHDSTFGREDGGVNVRQATLCPLTYGPPFMAPVQRELDTKDRLRLMAWLDDLLPAEPVDMIEWVGSDLRQPLHAVVVRFRLNNRPPLILVQKVAEIERRHLVQAIDESMCKSRRIGPDIEVISV